MRVIDTMQILEIEGLNSGYGKVEVLLNISFTMKVGQCFGIVGPNGVGKSTLLQTIAGAIKPKSGSIKLLGNEISGKNPEDIVRSGLALVPEGRQIFGGLTVMENLQLGLTGRVDKKTSNQAIEHVADLFPVITTHSKQQAGLLSGGQQQQLAIARALITDPKVLLLDEPSLGLAPNIINDLFSNLSRILEAGTTLLIVEQRANLVTKFADEILVLRDGAIQARLNKIDAQDENKLKEAYFGAGAKK